MVRFKDGIRIVDMKNFNENQNRFELRVEDINAPLCSFGNQRKCIGFDTEKSEYVRFTKSVLKKFLLSMEKQNVA